MINVCLSSDIAMGGGIPYGCTAIVSGKEKTGKTTFCIQAAASAQQQDPDVEVYYYNKERRLTTKVLQQIKGIDASRFHIVEPPKVTNKKGEVLGTESWTSEQWLEILGEQIKARQKCIFIFDSISSVASEKQASEGVGYMDRGASKKNETSFYQKYGDLVVGNEHVLFLVAQGYANTSGYGKSFLVKIGNSLKYMADLIMHVDKIEVWDTNKEIGRPLGHDIHWRVQESPMGPPHQDMIVPLRYGRGIDNERDILLQAINWGVVIKAGAWYKLPVDEKNKPTEDEEKMVKCQGDVKARNYLVANPKAAEVIEKMVKEQVFLYDTDDDT
jgi:recombination protein RecA